jgi:Anti-sigma factor NepR
MEMTMPETRKGTFGAGDEPTAADDSMSDGAAREDHVEIKLDEAAQALIGHHLKAMYGAVVQESIPDHLLKLLDELERKERQS